MTFATSDRFAISSMVCWSAVTFSVFTIQKLLNFAPRLPRNDFNPACEVEAVEVSELNTAWPLPFQSLPFAAGAGLAWVLRITHTVGFDDFAFDAVETTAAFVTGAPGFATAEVWISTSPSSATGPLHPIADRISAAPRTAA